MVSTAKYCIKVHGNSFFQLLATLWTFLHADCFLLTYNLNHFKGDVKRLVSLMIT